MLDKMFVAGSTNTILSHDYSNMLICYAAMQMELPRTNDKYFPTNQSEPVL